MVPMPPWPATSKISRPGKRGASSAGVGAVNGSSPLSSNPGASKLLPHSGHDDPCVSTGIGVLHRRHIRMVSISIGTLVQRRKPAQRFLLNLKVGFSSVLFPCHFYISFLISYQGIRGHALGQKHAGPDRAAGPDHRLPARNGRVGIDGHMILQRWMPLLSFERLAARK